MMNFKSATRQIQSEDEIDIIVNLANDIWVDLYSPMVGIEQVNYMLGSFH